MEPGTQIQNGGGEEKIVVVSELCRLCGAQDTKMLHLDDNFDILGVTSTILDLLTSISICLKFQDDWEELMPKHLCFSCFNTCIDIQAFIDSGISFQQTTINQLFPDARVIEIPLATVKVEQMEQIKNESVKQGHDQHKYLLNEKDTKREEHDLYLLDEKDHKKSQGLLNVKEIKESYGKDLTLEKGVDLNKHSDANDVPNSKRNSVDVKQDSDERDKEIEENNKTMDENRDKLIDFEDKSSFNSDSKSQKRGHLSRAVSDTKIEENNKKLDKDKGLDIEDKSSIKSDNKNHKQGGHLSRAARSKKCPVCKKTFPKQSQVKSHLASHSTERPFECPICSVRFKYRRNLVEHSALHNNNPSFICFTCGLTFKQKSNLLKHERIHGGKDNVKYKCKICSVEYTQSSHLKTHMNNEHSDNAGYKCSKCKVVVKCKSSLRRHETTVHASSLKFSCPHCNKGFNSYYNYEGHVRHHTGERPYSCCHCTKTFTTSKALARHTATHQPAARNHKCGMCGKGFLEQSDLKKHLRRHQQQSLRSKGRHRAKPQQAPVHTSTHDSPDMNSINLVVLNEELLFTQPHDLIHTTDTKVTQVMLEEMEASKLEAGKEVGTEGILASEKNIGNTTLTTDNHPPSISLVHPSDTLHPQSNVLHPTNTTVFRQANSVHSDSSVMQTNTAIIHTENTHILHTDAQILRADTPILQTNTPILQTSDTGTQILQPSNTPILQADTQILQPSSTPILQVDTPILQPSSTPILQADTQILQTPDTATDILQAAENPILQPSIIVEAQDSPILQTDRILETVDSHILHSNTGVSERGILEANTENPTIRAFNVDRNSGSSQNDGNTHTMVVLSNTGVSERGILQANTENSTIRAFNVDRNSGSSHNDGDTHTMVVLSNINTDQFIPIANSDSDTHPDTADHSRHQAHRVLSHSTW